MRIISKKHYKDLELVQFQVELDDELRRRVDEYRRSLGMKPEEFDVGEFIEEAVIQSLELEEAKKENGPSTNPAYLYL